MEDQPGSNLNPLSLDFFLLNREQRHQKTAFNSTHLTVEQGWGSSEGYRPYYYLTTVIESPLLKVDNSSLMKKMTPTLFLGGVCIPT